LPQKGAKDTKKKRLQGTGRAAGFPPAGEGKLSFKNVKARVIMRLLCVFAAS
jgi:hypothetical protein